MPWLAILTSKWTRYGLLVVALLVGGLALRAHFISVGEQRGKDQQAQSDQQDIELQRQAAQADARAKIADANARAEEANSRAAEYALKAQRLSGQLDAARHAVDSLPDSGLHPHIVAALGIRPPADTAPGYTPAEEREIARRVDAAPLLQQQTDALAAQVGHLSEQVKALGDAAAARDAYTARLEGWYTQLYNLHPPKARHWYCAWLCSTDKKLPVPAPSELRK